MTKKKKRILITLIIVFFVIVLLLIGAYFMINGLFSKVTDTVGEVLSGEKVALPVLDENQQIIKDKNISVVLDEETIKALEAKIPISEKLEVLAMLAKSLDPDDYSTLLSYAAGGVNNEKFNAAYSLLREKLSDENKEKIKSYYAKYMYLLEE